MTYEVVDPFDRDVRGPTFRIRDHAIAYASGSPLEVWQVADDDAHTRMVRVLGIDPPTAAARECPICRGSGRIHEDDGRALNPVPCTRCDGSGRLAGTADPPADPTSPEAVTTFVRENVGRADREATAALEGTGLGADSRVHALLAAMWGRGFAAGFTAGTETYTAILTSIMGPTTERSDT